MASSSEKTASKIAPLPKTVEKPTNEVIEFHCQTAVEHTIKIRYVWKIKQFQFFYDRQFEVLESPEIKTKSDESIVWRLRLFPRTCRKKDHSNIGLFLFLDYDRSKKDILCEFKFAILNSSQNVIITYPSEQHEFTEAENERGYTKFVKRDFLLDKDNDLLPNDELTIACDLEYVSTESVSHVIRNNFNSVYSIDVPDCNIIEDLSHLWLNECFSDVILSVDGKDFPAHKIILATRSSVFAAMFTHKMKETNSSRVEIADIDEKVFEELLRYIYTGKVNNLKDGAYDLLAAANKYNLERLKNMCEADLCFRLDAENAAKILILADMHNSEKLKKRTVDFIKTCPSDVMNTSTWKGMISSHPHLINEVCCAFAIAMKEMTKLACY